jgi:cytochrome c
MKSTLAIAFAAAALLATGVAQAQADLAEKAGCNKCHAADTKKMGPSYKDIAKKYKGNASAEADLVNKLKTGTGHPKSTASDADLAAVVKWILAM